MAEIPSLFDPQSVSEFQKEEEALKKGLVKRRRRGTTNEVCACGHPLNVHHYWEERDRHECKAGKTNCACVTPRAVLTADNLRMFMFATDGPGTKHALGKGMIKSYIGGHKMQWLSDPLHCDICERETDKNRVFPVAATPEKRISSVTTKVNVILCEECYVSWQNK